MEQQRKEKIVRNLRKGGICFTVASFILLLVNLYGAVAVLLLFIAYIMHYGAALQQESDETL